MQRLIRVGVWVLLALVVSTGVAHALAADLPGTAVFDSAPSLWIALVGAYFLLAGLMIKKFMRSYK